MSRKTLGAFVAAALLSLPAIANATKNVWTPHQLPEMNDTSQTTRLQQQQMTDRLMNRGTPIGSLGNGNNSKPQGNVTGPGTKARIDPSVNGPLNDINPGGQPSEDTAQAARPPR